MNLRPMLLTVLAAMAVGGCAPTTYTSPNLVRLESMSNNAVLAQAQTVLQASKTGVSDERILEIAKQVTADSLKDPDSARFRNVGIRQFGELRIVCGEVNGKNSYGGYVGFVRFSAGTADATLESRDSQYPELRQAKNFGIDRACGR